MNKINVLSEQFSLDSHSGVQDFQGVMYEIIQISLLAFQRTEGWKR